MGERSVHDACVDVCKRPFRSLRQPYNYKVWRPRLRVAPAAYLF